MPRDWTPVAHGVARPPRDCRCERDRGRYVFPRIGDCGWFAYQWDMMSNRSRLRSLALTAVTLVAACGEIIPPEGEAASGADRHLGPVVERHEAQVATVGGGRCWLPNFNTPLAPTEFLARPAVDGADNTVPSGWFVPNTARLSWKPPQPKASEEECPRSPLLDYQVWYFDQTNGTIGVRTFSLEQVHNGPLPGASVDFDYGPGHFDHLLFFSVNARNVYGKGESAQAGPIEAR
jgi:hypothetical protein